ncbi:protein IMPACT-like [Homalodisca vitripennis]|uniref:protein IMPACT-like n=1 Tax=Homalodisca vitripennis TaxID=197043 RepID=UPI001EEBA277|nr:protein IMPACT-like [Homalodisca vitripennis]
MEFLQNKYSSSHNCVVQDLVQHEHSNRKTTSNRSLKITHGKVVIDRKSIFKAHAALITPGGASYMAKHWNNERENAAGSHLLHLFQAMGATNVMVVVSRWRGGVNIGPDRFRHINSVARQVLQQLGFCEEIVSNQILLTVLTH